MAILPTRETDTHYLNPKLAAIYDIDSPWSTDRDFYLNLAGPKPIDILDLVCCVMPMPRLGIG